MSCSNNGIGQSGTVPNPESIPTKPKTSPLAKYVHSGVIIEVPSLVEEKLSDKTLDRGLKRWAHITDTENEKYSTTIMKEVVAYLKEKSSCYSRHDKRWVPWRTPKRAPLNDRSQKPQKEEEEEDKQEKHQVEQLVHPEQEQPDGGYECEQAKHSAQEEAPKQMDQPERIVQQVQQPTSESNVKKTVHEVKKRSSVPSVEEDIANFFNAIGNNIREMCGIDGLAFDSRIFSVRFRHSFPADAGVDRICKPGLVVLERWAADAPNAMWSDIKTLLEVRRSRSKAAQKDAYRYLVHCVKMVFGAQVNRRFVMGATVCGDIMTFFIFDRSGYLVSEAFDMNETVERVVRVVCGMLFVDEVRLGYDPTIFRDKEGRIVVKFKGVECMCAEDPLYVEKCVRGRGTACFETVYLGEPAVIKDAWVDDSRSKLEHEILDKVKDVEGVVKVVGNEIVQVPDEDDVLVDDTTSECRKILMKDDFWTTNAKWSGFHLVETRTHRRIMLQPCGGPLEGFANLRELLLAIRDIVKCVQDLLEKKVLHRDISLRNIILAKANPKDPNSRMRGYLIDFDYALDLDNQSQAAAKGARTGTLPFMALEMLEEESSNDVSHAYYHDLESIFYILCWICTSQEGPNNTERDRRTFDFNKSEVAQWAGIGMDNPSFKNIRRCKAAAVLNEPLFVTEVLSQFAPYFEPIKPCLLAMRALAVNTGSNCKDPLYLEMLKPRLQALEEARASGRPVSMDTLKAIPNSEREPCDVFNSLYDIIKRTLAGLVEPPLPAACTLEAKAGTNVEEEARKEAKQMKFRKYMSIREMQEEQDAFLRIKKSKAKGEEDGKDEPIKVPAYPPPTHATSSLTSLAMLKQATRNSMNARNTSSSVPGLTHSGPSESASGTSPRSIPSSPSSPMPDPQIGPPSSMESIGSKRAFDDDDQKSAHGRSMRKKAKKVSGLGKLPQPKGPCIQRPSLDSTMPSSVESTRSKRSLAESFDDDSVTSDSQKRIRLEKP